MFLKSLQQSINKCLYIYIYIYFFLSPSSHTSARARASFVQQINLGQPVNWIDVSEFSRNAIISHRTVARYACPNYSSDAAGVATRRKRSLIDDPGCVIIVLFRAWILRYDDRVHCGERDSDDRAIGIKRTVIISIICRVTCTRFCCLCKLLIEKHCIPLSYIAQIIIPHIHKNKLYFPLMQKKISFQYCLIYNTKFIKNYQELMLIVDKE